MGERARLFVAVWPPAELVDAIAAFPRPPARGVRWTTAEQWHVTLRFLGQADVDEARAAFRRVSGRAVEAIVGPETERFGQRVLHLPVEGLQPLAAAVVAATAGVGEPPDDRTFRGHLTLARTREKGADLRPFTGWSLSARWSVDDVTLVRSRTEARGARYDVVERLALATRPAAG